jgi:hypothetical protein
VIAGIAFIVIFLAAMFITTSGNAQFHCEVCMTFGGNTICRNGAATTREEAQRIAIASACTDLSSGMTTLMQCQSSVPKVTWK